MFQRIKKFLEESRLELKRVNWPNRKETTRYTLFVIGLSLGLAVFLGAMDYALLKVLGVLIL